jgi:solute carrier family 13 (sodium-dependent dicarboxylate transporter), member 2/3/5
MGLAAGVVACAAIVLAPTDLHRIEGYGSRPAYAAGVTALMVCWWLTEALPVAWTACVPLLLFPAFGVFGRGALGDVRAAATPFLDAYVFLFLGGMAIGAATERWNLHRRIALNIMRVIGTEPKRLLLGVIVATAFVSLWISNTATAVMMFPIGLALVKELEAARGGGRLSMFGTAIMLGVAYGANVGGMGTKIGSGPNSIFCGFVAEKLHTDIGFLQYLAVALPFVVLFVPVVWGVLWLLARRDGLDRVHGRELILRELSAMGIPSRKERAVAIVFLAAAALWISSSVVHPLVGPPISRLLGGFRVQGKHYEAGVSMLAAGSLVACRVLSLPALRRLPWGTLVLLGGSLAMAAGIEESGLSLWLGERFGRLVELPLAGQVAVATTGTIGLSAVASNVATINVVLNVLPASLPVLFAITMGASCDFMLPAGTPPNAIVFGSGYIRLSTMMRVGFLLDVAAAILITLYMLAYGQWVLFMN